MDDSDEAGAVRREESFPPRMRSDLDRLYNDGGGPAPITSKIDRGSFEGCCHAFPWAAIAPVLRKYQRDAALAWRYWPWAAFAISQFRYEQREAASHLNQPTPKEVLTLLGEIQGSAKQLLDGLKQLESLSTQVVEPANRGRAAHLEYLDQFISQAAAGLIDHEVVEDGKHELLVHYRKRAFRQTLVHIAVAAGEAMNRADKTLLGRKVGTRQTPGLHNLVFRASEIWTRMTGRAASANKVHSRGGQESQFVQFVQDLVGIAGGPKPSRRKVEITLANLAPRNTCENGA